MILSSRKSATIVITSRPNLLVSDISHIYVISAKYGHATVIPIVSAESIGAHDGAASLQYFILAGEVSALMKFDIHNRIVRLDECLMILN